MEPLPHGLWSCSSKPLTGRTGQAEGRFSYWKHHEPQPVPQEYSTGQGLVSTTTCLVGYTPLRLHTLQDTPTRHLARHLAGDDRLRIATASLRIAPGHSRLQSSRLPDFQDHINHRLLLGKINQMGTHLPTHHILLNTPFGNQ